MLWSRRFGGPPQAQESEEDGHAPGVAEVGGGWSSDGEGQSDEDDSDEEASSATGSANDDDDDDGSSGAKKERKKKLLKVKGVKPGKAKTRSKKTVCVCAMCSMGEKNPTALQCSPQGRARATQSVPPAHVHISDSSP